MQTARLPGSEMAMENLLLDQDVAICALNSAAAAKRLATLTLQLMQSITACKDMHKASHRRLLMAFLSAFSDEPLPARGTSSHAFDEQGPHLAAPFSNVCPP